MNVIGTNNQHESYFVAIKRVCVDDIYLHKNSDNQVDILQMFSPSGCNYSLDNVVNKFLKQVIFISSVKINISIAKVFRHRYMVLLLAPHSIDG